MRSYQQLALAARIAVGFILASYAAPSAAVQTVEVTHIMEVTRLVEVTRIFEVTPAVSPG